MARFRAMPVKIAQEVLRSEKLPLLQPGERASSLPALEDLEFRMSEVLRYRGSDRKNSAVRHDGHTLDMTMVIANKPHVFNECTK
jgi:hypothetical protein